LLSRIRKEYGLINWLFMSLYLFIVLFSHVFIVKSPNPLPLARSFVFTGAFSLFLSPFLLKASKKLSFEDLSRAEEKTESLKWFWIVSLLIFMLLLIPYMIYYPSRITADCAEQYEQAVSNSYSDWHPFFHTLFAYKLPLFLTGGWDGSILLFQILLLSLAIAHAAQTLAMHAGKRIALFALLFYLINPNTLNLTMFPWKDIAFAIGALLTASCSIRIYFTKGEWIRRIPNLILLTITLAFTSLFRHNAILFTLPAVFALVFLIPKKQAVSLILGFLILFGGIKYPLSSTLHVEQPGSRQTEMLGVPMNIISSVYVHTPEKVDQETLEFVSKIAPREKWERNYIDGIYNGMKWDTTVNNSIIEEYGAKRILKMTASCFIRSPFQALKAFFYITDPAYTITDDVSTGVRVDPSENGGISAVLGRINYYLSYLLDAVFSKITHFSGTMLLILVIAILSKYRITCAGFWKTVLFILPVFAYNFGSMLLLYSRLDAVRFFYYTFLVTPLYLTLFFRDLPSEKKASV